MKLDIFKYISFYNLLYKNDCRKYHANNLLAKMEKRNKHIIRKVSRYNNNYELWQERIHPKKENIKPPLAPRKKNSKSLAEKRNRNELTIITEKITGKSIVME